MWYLGERIRWNDAVGFLFILGAVFFVFAFKAPSEQAPQTVASPFQLPAEVAGDLSGR